MKRIKKSILLLLTLAVVCAFTPVKVQAITVTEPSKKTETTKKKVSAKEQTYNNAVNRAEKLNKKIAKYGWEISRAEKMKSTKKECILDCYLESPDKQFKKPVRIRAKRMTSKKYVYYYTYDGKRTTVSSVVSICKKNAYKEES